MIADVSGKGTPASLLMASVHASLRATAGTAPPAVVLERLNRFLYASTQDSRYVTLFYGELDPASRRLRYVNAGHVPPVPRRAPEARRSACATGGRSSACSTRRVYEEGEVVARPRETSWRW